MIKNLADKFQYRSPEFGNKTGLSKGETEFAIAIIGCGAAGVATLFSLLDSLPFKSEKKIRIAIYEKGPAFGSGFAYQCDSGELLMNMVSSTTSIIQNQECDFWNWMLDEGCNFGGDQIFSKSGIAPDGYVSRQYFGVYLRSRLEAAILALEESGIEVRLINLEVLNVIVMSSGCFEIICSGDRIEEFDCVILCIGNQPPEDLFNLKGKSQYINNPYPTHQFINLIKSHESVGIIGGQLTAADIAVVLANQGHQGQIYFFTRDCNYPLIRSRLKKHKLQYLTICNLENLKDENRNGITIRNILRLARKDFMLIGVRWNRFFKPSKLEYGAWIQSLLMDESEYSAWQNFAIATDSVIGHYWDALSSVEKNLFMSKFHRLWAAKRVPLPAHTALKLFSLFSLGVLKHYPNLKEINASGRNKFIVSIRDQWLSGKGTQIHCDWVINASGPSKNINSSESALVKNLLKSGTISINPHGGIMLDYETSLIRNIDDQRVENFYAIGQVTSGTYYFVSSLDMVSLRAKSLVNHISNRLSSGYKNQESVREDRHAF